MLFGASDLLSITASAAASVFGAKGLGPTDEGVASYRLLGIALGVGSGPVGSPRRFFASAVKANCSSSVVPWSIFRWK